MRVNYIISFRLEFDKIYDRNLVFAYRSIQISDGEVRREAKQFNSILTGRA